MSHRIVIVGGVAAGASAATRARRLNEQAEITVFEKSGYVSFANCGLPYHIGGVIRDRNALLLQSPEQFKRRFNIDVHVRHEVTTIDRSKKRVEVVNLETGQARWERYDRLILAMGASPIIPPIEGVESENVFTLRSVEDMDSICAQLESADARRAAVVGAGFIGLEVAEVLVRRGVRVDLIELAEQVLPPLDADMARLVENELVANGVSVHLGQAASAFEIADGRVRTVLLPDGTRIETDMVLMSIGVRPNSRIAKEAGLEIGPRGGIRINERLQTADPDILAVGDVAEIVHTVTGGRTPIPLAGPANKHGRLAGEIAAAGEGPPAPSAAGTAIVKIFKLSVATTGLGVKGAQKASLDAGHVLIRRGHHVGYYPGSEDMTIKLVFERDSRRVLGAQIVGGAGVDRRIDVIATAIHFGGKTDDLTALDLAYAPQFGAAKDPVHIAAFVADNENRGLLNQIDVADLATCLKSGYQLIDVRTPVEFAAGTIPGAINIELDHLRERLSEIDAKRPVLVFCQVGQRGYNAARVLMNSGRRETYNLGGGYAMYASGSR